MGVESTREGKKAAEDEGVPPSSLEEEPYLAWPRFRATMQEAFSEFFGVMIMILFGDGSVAQVTLSDNMKGEYQSITWGWG